MTREHMIDIQVRHAAMILTFSERSDNGGTSGRPMNRVISGFLGRALTRDSRDRLGLVHLVPILWRASDL